VEKNFKKDTAKKNGWPKKGSESKPVKTKSGKQKSTGKKA